MKLMKLTKLSPYGGSPEGRQASQGFTLIETLFAILIFSTALATLLVVSGGGIANADFAKNQMIASSLAREGIEMVRTIRDNNFLNGGGWRGFRGPSGVADCINECIINPFTLITTICTPPCPDLKYDGANGFYNYSSGSASLFQRVIRVNFLANNYEAEVTSTVFWNQGAVQRQVTFTENLFDWY